MTEPTSCATTLDTISANRTPCIVNQPPAPVKAGSFSYEKPLTPWNSTDIAGGDQPNGFLQLNISPPNMEKLFTYAVEPPAYLVGSIAAQGLVLLMVVLMGWAGFKAYEWGKTTGWAEPFTDFKKLVLISGCALLAIYVGLVLYTAVDVMAVQIVRDHRGL